MDLEKSLLERSGFDQLGDAQKRTYKSIAKVSGVILSAVQAGTAAINKVGGNQLSLWIDTLCVPLDRRYRKLAISRMGQVYARSARTVVLDSELQKLEAAKCSREELLLRIGLSSWMRRVWTFQEAALSGPKLRLVFSDQVIQLPLKLSVWDDEPFPPTQYFFPKASRFAQQLSGKEARLKTWLFGTPVIDQKAERRRLQDEAQSHPQTPFTGTNYLYEEVKMAFTGIRRSGRNLSGFEQPLDVVHRIRLIWESLRLRATSHEEDRFVCFSLISAVDYKERDMIKKLLDLSPEERMKSWIMWHEIIPAGLLFLPGPKYEQKGFRWVSKEVCKYPLDDKEAAVRDKATKKLVFKKPGFLFSGKLTERKFFIVDRASSVKYLTTLEMPDGTFEAGGTLPNRTARMGIIVRKAIGKDGSGQIGALLQGVQQLVATIRGDFVCLVDVRRVREEECDVFQTVSADSVDKSQGWVIS